jgi:hypothetical protein
MALSDWGHQLNRKTRRRGLRLGQSNQKPSSTKSDANPTTDEKTQSDKPSTQAIICKSVHLQKAEAKPYETDDQQKGWRDHILLAYEKPDIR